MINYRGDGSALVVLAGEYDIASAASIDGAVREALEHGSLAVVLDMAAVEFLDSTAIGAMVRARRECAAAGATLTVADASYQVARILAFTELSKVFGVAEPARQVEQDT